MYPIILLFLSTLCFFYEGSICCMERPSGHPLTIRIFSNQAFKKIRRTRGPWRLVTENVNSFYGDKFPNYLVDDLPTSVPTEDQTPSITDSAVSLSHTRQCVHPEELLEDDNRQKKPRLMAHDDVESLSTEVEARIQVLKATIQKEYSRDTLLEQCNAHKSAKPGCVATLQPMTTPY